MANVRFRVYRTLVAFLTWLSFRTGRIEPLNPPDDEHIRFVPYGSMFPEIPIAGVVAAETFPAADKPGPRLRRIAMTKRLLGLVGRIPPAHGEPVPDDEGRFVAAVYPAFFRRAWPTPPGVPPQLRAATTATTSLTPDSPTTDSLTPDRPTPVKSGADLMAELAIRGPFASYLRAATAEEIGASAPSGDNYVIDLSWMLEYPVTDGLARPGGKAFLAVRDGRLATVAIHGGEGGDARWPPHMGRRTLLAAMNEDLTTFRHNLSVHLVILTSFAIATTNNLPRTHPLRRLLHHCFHTVLIGNREVAELQFSGRLGFSARIFSHDHHGLTRMANDYLQRFDFWDFEPETQFARRGTAETPFAYPYRENVLRMWNAHRWYVEDYLDIYYPEDATVRADADIARWVAELNGLLPNGVKSPAEGPTVDWLVRLCATLIHISTVEHDYLNNVVWNYSTLSWIVPTVVPLSGERMDQRRAFDLIATIIGTWKPYNMLLTADIPSLALDERARQVMQEWIDRLAQVQKDMSAEAPATAPDLSLSYPANLNVSISN